MINGFEKLEPRVLLSGSPLVFDGFDTAQYAVGSQLDGSDPFISGFDGSWVGSGSASIESGSLGYAGLGAAGTNRVQLNNSIVVSRQFALGAGDPLSNYIDSNGHIGASQDGSALYLSLLMQVDGSSPPASTFSLYNDGTSSLDRELRILYSGSNTHFQAIAGPSGTAAALETLNNGTNYDIAFDRLAFTRFVGTGTAQFDELRLGSAWSAVTDEAALNLILRPPIDRSDARGAPFAAWGWHFSRRFLPLCRCVRAVPIPGMG